MERKIAPAALVIIAVLCLGSSVFGATAVYEYFYNQTSGQYEPSAPGSNGTQDSGLGTQDGNFSIMMAPVTIRGVVNYLDDNVTRYLLSYSVGPYTIGASAERPDNSSGTLEQTQDIIPPAINITSAKNTTITTTSHTFTITLDETANCTLHLNGTDYANPAQSTSLWWAATLGQGNYSRINFTCDDLYNNSATSGTYWLNVDSIAPAITWDWNDINSTITVRYTTVCVNLSETGNCTLNWAGSYIANSTAGLRACWTRTSLTNGNYSVSAACDDLAGNGANSSNAWLRVNAQYCGDGSCNAGETCSSCPSDCGSCGGGSECSRNSDCDDDNACTTDTCSGGNCRHSSITCNDDNLCTTDSCSRSSGCVFTPNSNSCNDGDACTLNDRCSGGSCSGTPKACNDNNLCTTDSCSNGNCVFTPNTATCNDNNLCTINDVCSGGSCAGAQKDCSDGIACTTDSCVEGSCVHDASGCGCAQSGDCPAIQCKSASCVAGSCQYADAAGPCDDGNACTENDVCSLGSCVGAEIACDDSNICTDDSCDAESGCVFTNNVAGCDDANACTESDYCMNGICTSGEYTCPCAEDSDCDDSNPCTSEVCSLGSCVYSDASGACDDGDKRTEGDYCSGGKCVPGQRIPRTCRKDWECEDWSSCVLGLQSRVCECECDDPEDCEGDNMTQRACESGQHPILTLAAIGIETNEGLKVGDILRITLTDEDGRPMTGDVILIRPDGTNVTVTGSEFIVDQAGIWKIVVKKEGYREAEKETVVAERPKPASDIASQVSEAVTDFVESVVNDPVRFTLLLATVIGIAGAAFFLKTQRKKEIEKL